MEPAYVHQPKRLLPLDALRSLIMILMAIDHANYPVARMHHCKVMKILVEIMQCHFYE
jgi:uncharacterized membrane protein